MRRALWVDGNRYFGDINEGGKGYSSKWKTVEWSCKTVKPYGTLVVYKVNKDKIIPERVICNLYYEDCKDHTRLKVETMEDFNILWT
jgi:hypothetical protein